MLSYVEYGRTNDMKRFFQRPVSGRPGKMAPDAIRQQKNLIVCTATLVTRAAIRGGLDPETAFNLSDMYIQKAELLNNYVALTRLNVKWLWISPKESKKCAAAECIQADYRYSQLHSHTLATP